MILQKCSFCFLILFVTFCSGNLEDSWITSELDQYNLENFSQDSKYDVSLVNINKIFDQILPKIRDILVSKGLEPTILPNLNEEIIEFPGALKAKVTLKNGYLHYMTDIRRSKNVTMQYKNKNLFFNLPLRWQLLSMNYDFYLTHMFIKRRGEFYGRIDDAEFNIKLQMNLENYHITLQELKILSISSFNLKIQGNKSDPILNILARALSRFFENSIIKLIENSGLELFSPLIKSLNQKLGKSKSKVNNFIDAL